MESSDSRSSREKRTPAPAQQEPVSDRQEPAPDQQEPASDQQEPAPDQQESVPGQQKPAPDQQQKPASGQQQKPAPGQQQKPAPGQQGSDQQTGKVLPASYRAAVRHNRPARIDTGEEDRYRNIITPEITNKLLEIIHQNEKDQARAQSKRLPDGTPLLEYTTLSLRSLSRKLKEEKISICFRSVGSVLEYLGFEKQNNRREGVSEKEVTNRTMQMIYLKQMAAIARKNSIPMVCVDTKQRRDLVCADPDRLLDPSLPQAPVPRRQKYTVPLQDFRRVPPRELFAIDRKVAVMHAPPLKERPYVALECLCRWWDCIGSQTFPNADCIHVLWDNEGIPKQDRTGLWETVIQYFAEYTGCVIQVAHMPSICYRWNDPAHQILSLSEVSTESGPALQFHAIVTTVTDREVLFRPRPADLPLITQLSEEDVWAEPTKEDPYFPVDWDYRIYPTGMEPDF